MSRNARWLGAAPPAWGRADYATTDKIINESQAAINQANQQGVSATPWFKSPLGALVVVAGLFAGFKIFTKGR